MIYSMYSKYYDALNTGYENWLFPMLRKEITKINGSLLELGCGTGNILQYFKNDFTLSGVDISNHMLDIARLKLPNTNFINCDMARFISKEKHDVVLCLFDSINHVLDINKWHDVFTNTKENMKDDGIFIFDMNTTGRLNKIASKPPLFVELNDNYFYMNLKKNTDCNFIFDVRVLKRIDKNHFEEEREEIEETTVDGYVIYKELKGRFSIVKVLNEKMEEIEESDFINNEQYRWFFICRK